MGSGGLFGAAAIVNASSGRGLRGKGPWWVYLIVILFQWAVISVCIYVLFFDANFLGDFFNV